MGGKTWSREEELFFWRTIVPISPKAAVRVGTTADWQQCASMMKRHFGVRARRNYTKLMLFEHYFQNITTGHKSPRAADLVAEHKRHLEPEAREMDAGEPRAEHRPRVRQVARRMRTGGDARRANRPSGAVAPPEPLADGPGIGEPMPLPDFLRGLDENGLYQGASRVVMDSSGYASTNSLPSIIGSPIIGLGADDVARIMGL
ncbi:hypothetical protein CDD83_2922 [Cordyceps sp. RAO-2017]|nr:hypothetical protein CDD83_2922 [Cordyceps sp. RAO-2017]